MHSHQHGHEEEHVPDRSTPQGSQSYSVEHGHELRDVNFVQIKIWFTVLAAVVAGSMVFTAAAIFLYQKLEPPPLRPVAVLDQARTPPAPRLLPNEADSGHLRKEEQIGPAEAYELDEERQGRKLAQLGLRDPDHDEPHISAEDVALVAGEGSARPAGQAAPQGHGEEAAPAKADGHAEQAPAEHPEETHP